MEKDGIFAEYAAVPSRHVFEIPEKVSFEEGWPYIEFLVKDYQFSIHQPHMRKTAEKFIKSIWQVFYDGALRGVVYISETDTPRGKMLFLDR